MVTASLVAASVSSAVLALTLPQRWTALRQFNTNAMTESGFIVTGIVAILVLTAVLFVVSNKRKTRQQSLSNKIFAEYAEKRGLSTRERLLLLDIVCSMGFLQIESIFTLSSAFDRGAAKQIEECSAEQGIQAGNHLRSELSFLREKLGFQKQHPSSIALPTQSKKLSSRQISVGRKLNIVRLKARSQREITGTLIKNNGVELCIRLTEAIKTVPGEVWRVRYYFGASVWEFDTSVINYHDRMLVINHSDSVRFINRRRFLRVPINKPAFIARFPFTKNIDRKEDEIDTEQNIFEPPQFVPAVITELAGPGLRIETTLKLKENKDRVIVMFRLDKEKKQTVSPGQYAKTTSSKIVSDIAEVRHVKAMGDRFSIAVELTKLSDLNVNELIRDTNAESIRAGRQAREAEQNARGYILNPVEV